MIPLENIKNFDQFQPPTTPSQQCHLCLKFLHYFIEQYINDSHTQNHAQKKNQFHCSKCNRNFGAAIDFQQHQRDKHQVAVCKLCGKEVGGFKKIICDKHNTNKKKDANSIPKKIAFHCEICNRVFLRAEDIRKHDEAKHSSKKSKKRC
ncbi:37571_t:CDS:1 [Gigaspora margarita]|nr:37571_t:CDS:1 [Gigaspora margarita]